MATLEVGTARADRGAKGQGGVEVVRRHDGSSVIIPVMLVNGLRDGPTLVVQGGIHGSEYPGIEAVWHLVQSLEPAKLSGSVIAIPVTNVPAFEIDDRCNDIDHQDLNRIFPGKPDGTLSERTAHQLLTAVISRANYMIDLHASSEGEIVPVAIARRGYEELSVALAKASGFEFIWMGGKLGVGGLGQASAIALSRGIPATTLEAGGGREYHPQDADVLCGAVINIMKHLRMIDGQPSKPKHRVIFKADVWGQVGAGGFFRPFVAAGQRVKKGDLIATIHDVYGREMERINAPNDGLICLLNKKRSVQTGDYAHIFGEILEEETVE